MIKLVTIMYRRPGMAKADYEAHYEQHHRKIGEKVLAGYACHYVRRHLRPFDGADQPGDADTVMEIWYPDRATLDRFFESIAADPAIAQEIAEDEERFLDRPRMRIYLVEEFESAMPDAG